MLTHVKGVVGEELWSNQTIKSLSLKVIFALLKLVVMHALPSVNYESPFLKHRVTVLM